MGPRSDLANPVGSGPVSGGSAQGRRDPHPAARFHEDSSVLTAGDRDFYMKMAKQTGTHVKRLIKEDDGGDWELPDQIHLLLILSLT